MTILAADLMPDFSGHSLERDRYRLLKSVGAGAYGKVYRAIDMSHRSSREQVVAIKCLHKPRPASRAYLMQRREFEHHKLVSGHPNIVTFHGCFSDGLHVYVVLDFCNGGDLYTAITEKRLFHENDPLIKSAFVQLIDAVAHCHKLGVYHRDIKPENILCSDDGSVIRLSDFGLSIRSPYSTEFGCGSCHYMSPECLCRQVHHREYSTSYNDIWALGVILTNIITGRIPWRYAILEDECFAAYISDNGFLKRYLPISEGANDILKSIFIVNPVRRLTLVDLRTKISALDMFSILANEEVPYGDSAKGGVEQPDSDVRGSQVSARVFEAGSPDLQSISDPESHDIPIHIRSQSGSLAVPFSDSSGSSGPESKGPVTPTTRAVDVDLPIDIPDISNAVLGDAADLRESSGIYKPQEVVTSAKARRPANIFRAAVQRIRMLSKGDPVS